MHIVLVCREFVGSIRSGGIGSYMDEIAKAYIGLKHKVTIVTASDDTRIESRYEKNGYTVISLSGGDFFCDGLESGSKLKKLRLLYRFHSYRRKLRKVIMKIPNVDIVEVPDYGAEALYLQDLSIPVVIRLHTPLSLSRVNLKRIKPRWSDIRRYFGLKSEDYIFKNAKYITSCSQSLLDWFHKNYDLSPRLTEVIKNPINITNVLSSQPSDETKTIFYAGTISETKGVGDLIEACTILRRRGVDVNLKLAGKGGSYSNHLRENLNEEGATWCDLLGKLPRKDVCQMYTSATVCCFPSWWENMPMVVLESMSYGAIVVSTDAGGTNEIIHDGIDGLLVPPKSPLILSEVLYKALTLDKDTKSFIQENAKKEIRQNYNPSHIATKMIHFFDRVINDFNSINR